MAKKQTTPPAIQLTQAGYNEIVEELEELRQKQQDAIERVSVARSHGDLSENAEYHAAKEDLTLVTARVEELEAVLHQAKVIRKSGGTKTVTVGSTVTLKHGKKSLTYQVVTAWEADPAENKISSESPLGTALLSKKVGQKVKVQVPAGEQTYEILKIQ